MKVLDRNVFQNLNNVIFQHPVALVFKYMHVQLPSQVQHSTSDIKNTSKPLGIIIAIRDIQTIYSTQGTHMGL
jgi:hypothetical protein